MNNTTPEQSAQERTRPEFPKPDASLLRPHLIANHDLIPLNPPKATRKSGKAPLEDGWRERDYSGQDPVSWMAQGFNVGVRLRKDQLVIDVDPRNFNGSDRFAELCELLKLNLDLYPRVFSGGGGQHIYMSKPPELETCASMDGFPGIEFKSHGVQLVAGGSVHPDSGLHYRADDPFGDLEAPPMAPEVLLQAIARKRSGTREAAHGTLTPKHLAELLGVLDPVSFRQYERWLSLMMACHQGTGGSGGKEFTAWCTQDPEYANDAREILDKWDRLDCERPDGVTVRTLFHEVIGSGHAKLVEKISEACRPSGDSNPVETGWVARKRFVEMSLEELQGLQAPKWLVDGLIPEGGLAVVYGQPKACKTFWAIDLALSIATGRPFHGLPTRQGRATYIAAEGGPARLRDRARAWLKTHGDSATEVPSWRLIAERVDVSDVSDTDNLVTALDGPRDLIVIDTLARCMTGDENSQKDMGAFVAGCDRIRVATGAAVLVVHHEGKDSSKGARGSNALRGAVDVGIRVRREGGGTVVVTVEDQRDGEPMPETTFELRNVPLDGIEDASAALFETQNSNRSDDAILAIAATMNGVKKRLLNQAVAEAFHVSLSTAVRRTHNAIPMDQEHAVSYGAARIWLERADQRNARSGLVVRVQQISEVK